MLNFRGYRGGKDNAQMDAYYDCFNRFNSKCNWISFFDIDEYLFINPLHGKNRTIQEMLDNPKYDGAFTTDYAYCKHILLENGVPAQAILKEDRAMQSMENAAFSAQVLNDQGITPTRAILCCQAFHARRSFLSYSKFFPETEILVIPVSTQDIRREDWFMSKKSYQKVMSEVAKCGKYFMDFE